MNIFTLRYVSINMYIHMYTNRQTLTMIWTYKKKHIDVGAITQKYIYTQSHKHTHTRTKACKYTNEKKPNTDIRTK